MNFIQRIVETVKNAFSDLVNEISCRIKEWQTRREIAKEKKGYIGRLTGSEIQYEPEEPDKELALRVVSYLRERFPDSLSGSPLHGVFRPYEEILRKLQTQPDLEKRFFLESEDLITLSDGTRLTVYNQWGQHFPNFLEVATQLHEVECFSNNN